VEQFDAIYRQYGRAVHYYLLSLSHDELLAEELTQETMCRAIMNIGAFRGECKLSVWLCQIAKNLYSEAQKKRGRTVSMEETGIPEPAGRDIAEELSDGDTAQRILRHLHELEDPYKEVFMLHALGDVPLTQVSRLFGKSDSWARVTYYRAKTMIIARLGGEE